MSQLFTIKDDRTKFCRKAMKANGGIWNPVTQTWMFSDPTGHANALCELYRATRPSTAQVEALITMAVDGTGAQAWDFHPDVDEPEFGLLSRDEASRLLSAGYAVRHLLGTHPCGDLRPEVPSDAFDASPFEERVERSRRRQRAS